MMQLVKPLALNINKFREEHPHTQNAWWADYAAGHVKRLLRDYVVIEGRGQHATIVAIHQNQRLVTGTRLHEVIFDSIIRAGTRVTWLSSRSVPNAQWMWLKEEARPVILAGVMSIYARAVAAYIAGTAYEEDNPESDT